MKIALIAPGEISIPTTGWGALETVVWHQCSELNNRGHQAVIMNNSDAKTTYEQIASFNPDVVHLHYGKHYELLPHINCKKIITNHDGSFINSLPFHENIMRKFMYDCEFFILTTLEYNLLRKIGFSASKIKILPNGVDNKLFVTKAKAIYPDTSICLGKIDQRKNQAKLQKLNLNIAFVGQNSDSNFNPLDSQYLGPWSREEVYNKLTDFSNLVLLSQSELQPLVCLEALSAGLGLVISETSAQNLDTSLDFITVVPNDQLDNVQYISNAILKNRQICQNTDRATITNYAKSFDWTNIITKYEKYLT